MSSQFPPSPDPLHLTPRAPNASDPATPKGVPPALPRRDQTPAAPPSPALRRFGLIFPLLVLLVAVLLVAGRLWLRHAATAALPPLDGSLTLPGLSAPVTVARDAHGVPHLHAATLEDLVFAQGFVTAEDRLFQMDTIRRHAAGELAEVLGSNLLAADRVQRLLQIRSAADRAVAVLPPEQLHWLQLYARGVNASIAAQAGHLPIEFRILHYDPKPWTPRDSLLCELAMFEDLTNSFPAKLNREAFTARLAPTATPEARAELLDDLYPVGSWRDHPPTEPLTDLTIPVPEIEQVPLDPSQTRLNPLSTSPADLLQLTLLLAPVTCPECRAGSNNWVVAGSRTASGKPLLSNDMHLTHNVPGLWYETDLLADTSPTGAGFHAAGVALPGTPFLIVGHNDHVAWGFTNLGADVQDLSVEHLRGTGSLTQFQTPSGDWQPVLHTAEIIHVRGNPDVTLDVLSTVHGSGPVSIPTPIISPLFPSESRSISLRWTVYDPANVTAPFFPINAAPSGAALVDAFSTFGGPAQNLVYADTAGHIGYHAVGRIPIRGSLALPAPLSPVPTDISSFNALSHEWAGYVPYTQLPEAVDPVGGVLATANARVATDPYPFPITLNWSDPYRNERLWKVLGSRHNLTGADMLALQGDVYSDPDRVIGQRLAYAIDNVDPASLSSDSKRLHQAADLLRSWNGNVDANAAAPAIVDATRAALWPILLTPKLVAGPTSPASKGGSSTGASTAASVQAAGAIEPWQLYTWGERAYAEEQIVMHGPARWLPAKYPTWDALLVAALEKGLVDNKAPSNLAKWRYGKLLPLEIQHPLFAQSALLARVFGLPTGTGVRPQSGDGTTVKQVGRTFGPSERFTADLSDLDNSTLNLVLGQSGNPASPFFLDQLPAWLSDTTYKLPFTPAAIQAATTHTLTLNP